MQSAVQTIIDETGGIGALVNNAGYSQSGPVEMVSLALVRRQFQTNVFGPMRLTQLVLPGMRARRQGRVVNIGSMGGRLTFPGAVSTTPPSTRSRRCRTRFASKSPVSGFRSCSFSQGSSARRSRRLRLPASRDSGRGSRGPTASSPPRSNESRGIRTRKGPWPPSRARPRPSPPSSKRALTVKGSKGAIPRDPSASVLMSLAGAVARQPLGQLFWPVPIQPGQRQDDGA